MTIRIRNLKAILASIILVSSGASGSDSTQNSFVCGKTGDLRLISIEYLDPPKAVPCRVVYNKTQEGSVEYPWNAKNQIGYCENKAKFLAEKLAGLGVTCREGEDRSDVNNSRR